MEMIVTNPYDVDAGGWQGELELDYGAIAGKTVLQRSYHRAPLKVQRSLYPEGDRCCHTVMLHTAGGIVGGDRLATQIHLAPQSHALLTTAAATKLYRSNGPEAEHRITAQVEPGAVLEWLPQEAIAFNGANYRQTMAVDLEPGAIFAGWEITRFGRTARGEQFLTGMWRSHLELYQNGVPIWCDRQGLPGGMDTVTHPHSLNQQPIIGSFLWFGQPITPELLHTLRQLPPPPQGEFGLTTTQHHGLLARYRGASTTDVKQWFITLWQYLRQQQLNRPPLKLRIWG